MKSHRLTTR